MRAILVGGIALVLATGCASVKLVDNFDGRVYEDSKWQTGLVGMFQDDIVARHNDGSCVRITWNKISQWFLAYTGTEVYIEKPCSQ